MAVTPDGGSVAVMTTPGTVDDVNDIVTVNCSAGGTTIAGPVVGMGVPLADATATGGAV